MKDVYYWIIIGILLSGIIIISFFFYGIFKEIEQLVQEFITFCREAIP